MSDQDQQFIAFPPGSFFVKYPRVWCLLHVGHFNRILRMAFIIVADENIKKFTKRHVDGAFALKLVSEVSLVLFKNSN